MFVFLDRFWIVVWIQTLTPIYLVVLFFVLVDFELHSAISILFTPSRVSEKKY